MNLGAALVQGGLLSRDVDAYNNQQAESGLRMRQIRAGIQRMDDDEAARPERLRIEQLRRDIESAELEYKRQVMPKDQANADRQRTLTAGNLDSQIALQPGAAELARATQNTQLAGARAQERMQPGQIQLAEAQQQEQLRTAREQQLARLWGVYSSGDRAGFLDMLNNSNLVAPGRKFSEADVGNATGPDGQPVPGLAIVPADNGPPIFIPVAQLQALHQKYNTKYEKVGNNLLRIDARGGVTPVYEQDAFMAVPEGSTVASRRTGETVRGGAGGSNMPRRWNEGLEKGMPQREALNADGSKKIDIKTGQPVMETDETLAPAIRDMVRANRQALGRAGVSPEEAVARFGDFAKAITVDDPVKAFTNLDQAGRLQGIKDPKTGVTVGIMGRIGTDATGAPILVYLPTGLEKLLMDVELDRAFRAEQESGNVDEAGRLAGRYPKSKYPQHDPARPYFGAPKRQQRPAAAAGIN